MLKFVYVFLYGKVLVTKKRLVEAEAEILKNPFVAKSFCLRPIIFDVKMITLVI